MRFDSVAGLLSFLMALGTLGYSAPSMDYKKDMQSKGLDKHISYYTWTIRCIRVNKLYHIWLDAYYYGEKVYSIECLPMERLF